MKSKTIKRKEVAKLYFENINHPEVKLLPKELIKTSSWHLFPLKVQSNEVAKQLCAHLQSFDIGCSDIYYAKSMGLEPALDGIQGEREVANNVCGKVVCIPITPFLTKKDVQFISEKVNQFNREKTNHHEDIRP